MIGSGLLRYADNQRFGLFDIESEGLNLAFTRPWQIAYIIFTNKTVEKVVNKHILWNDLNISDEAARVTRFDRQHYLSFAEDPHVVLAEFERDILDPTVIPVFHNGLGFDVYPLEVWRRACGKKTTWDYVSRCVDTNCLAKAYKKGIHPDRENFVAWQYKLQSFREKGLKTSLGVMAKEFGIPYDENKAHDALYDCDVNRQVFQKLIWSVEI